MAIISGKNMKVRFGAGSATHKITALDIDDEAGEVETTNSESSGFYESEDSGIRMLTVRLDGDYDVGAAPLTNLAPGTTISTLVLYLNGTAGQPFYSIATFRILNAKVGGETKGKVKFSLMGKATGTFSRPTT